MFDTKALNNAAPHPLGLLCEAVLPFRRPVIVDDERIDAAGHCPASADLRWMRDRGQCHRVGRHKFLGAWHSRKRNSLLATAPEVVAHTPVLAVAVREA